MSLRRNWTFVGVAGALALGTVACVQATGSQDDPIKASGGGDLSVVTGGGVQAKVEPTGVPKAEPNWKEEVLMTGFNTPWGLAFLPDGRMLVTERAGRLLIVDPKTGAKTEVSGLPETIEVGQGGLMDVVLHPKFAQNGLVYMTTVQGTRQGNYTVLARGKLVGNQLQNAEVIFKPNFAKPGGQHFGSRIVWMADGTLLMSIGDGGNPPSAINGRLTRHHVQDLGSHIGKVLRLDENGKAPKNNPFVGKEGALPEIYSLGHRNIQGMARDPKSGRVYANEHGARGGDEVNVIEAGKNYGWPEATFSFEYSGPKISDHTSLPGMVDPIVAWTPCPAPCGMAFYSGDKYPKWKGDVFSGGLAGQDVRRIDLDEQGRVLGITQLNMGSRVRDVRQGPDGFLYVLTEGANARLSRIVIN